MKCKKCGSERVHKNGVDARTGKQQYRCRECGSSKLPIMDDSEETPSKRPSVGMTLSEFRSKHDVDFIVKRTLSQLDKNMIYEKSDICKLTGLRAGYPGLSQTIDDQKKYYGKVGSNMYFSHPDTIAELKDQAKLM